MIQKHSSQLLLLWSKPIIIATNNICFGDVKENHNNDAR